MIRINARGAVYGEVWYDEETPSDSGVDIVLYRQREAPIADAQTTPFPSLVTDLADGEDAIVAGFGKECRYKIRRAEMRYGLRMEFIMDAESRLDEFHAYYDAFARQKSLEPADHEWLVAACKARQLVLSSASQNGEALGLARPRHVRRNRGLSILGVQIQKQEKRLSRPGRASQPLATLERHAAVQGDRYKTL